tara:strand:- start:3826 stop:4542 length:717 start_codon:yes stop_codon:yes gene_type:complete
MALVSEFCVQAEESIKVSRLDYFAYVCVKGLETLTHVFRMLLLYSKNLDITFYNCKKALYYYLEFIGQIGEDNHEFLKLTSNDASLFVYKKTVFSVNQSYRKEYDEIEKLTTDNLFTLTELFLSIFKREVPKRVNNSTEDLTNTLRSLTDYTTALLNMDYKDSDELYNKHLKAVLKFNDALSVYDISDVQDLLTAIVKKIPKVKVSIEDICSSVSSSEINREELTLRKYINSLFANCS